MRKVFYLIGFLFIFSNAQAGKNDIDYLNFSSLDQFKDFAKDLTSATAFKTVRPVESLGLVGFDLGVSYNISSLKYQLMDKVSDKGGDSLDTVTFHATKGLPLGIDFGLNYSTVPNSNVSSWSGELSVEIIEEQAVIPNVGLIANYTHSTGFNTLEFQSFGFEVGISKSIFNFTPYASIGMIQGYVKPLQDNQVDGVELKEVPNTLPKISLGVNINLLVMDLLVAANQVGEVPTYDIKLGYRF